MSKLILPFLVCFLSILNAQDKVVYKLFIHGIIDNGLAPYIERGLSEADEAGADLVLLDINTFGGRVDAATEIKDVIMNSKVPTVAFVNKRAISAGSLIALSANKIMMTPGSSMGATTVVDGQGEKQSEKAQSYMRAEMGATAEKNGRDKKIAEAMVDEEIEIEGIIEKGKLLTLTAEEAKQHGFCEGIYSDEWEIYEALDLGKPTVISVDTSIAEQVVRFFTNPIVSSLLMTIGFLGLIFELKTAGWGVGGTIGLVALALFFGSHYIINLADQIEIIIFVVSLILILLEVFVIPGFGVAGVLGIIGLLASFYLTLVGRYPTTDDLLVAGATLSTSFILTIIGSYYIIKRLPETKFLNFLIVKERISKSAGVSQSSNLSELVGLNGVATTDLRLSGRASIDTNDYQVVSKNEYISKGEAIKVESVSGNKITVVKYTE